MYYFFSKIILYLLEEIKINVEWFFMNTDLLFYLIELFEIM